MQRHLINEEPIAAAGAAMWDREVDDLRVLAPVRIIATDVDEKKLNQTKALGAGLVLDCLGVQPTIDPGAKLLGRSCVWTIVGLGGGHHDFHHGRTPCGCSVSIPYWGSRVELMEVIAMARDGRIHAETTEYPLDQAVEVYEGLKAGQITGRAVLIPDGS